MNGRAHHHRPSYHSHHESTDSLSQWVKHPPRPRDKQGNLLSQQDQMMAEYVLFLLCFSVLLVVCGLYMGWNVNIEFEVKFWVGKYRCETAICII